MKIQFKSLPKHTPSQRRQISSLNAKYSRQNPDYYSKIKKNIKYVRMFTKVIIRIYNHRLQLDNNTVKIIQGQRINIQREKQKIQSMIKGQATTRKLRGYVTAQKLLVRSLQDSDHYYNIRKQTQEMKQTILNMIFDEKITLQRAKQEDDQISSELASISVEEVESVATLRYSRYSKAFDLLLEMEEKREQEWIEQGLI